MKAPVAIFAYRRPENLRRMLEALSRCNGFAESPILVFSDGPRGTADAADVQAVRALVTNLGWKNLEWVFSESNKGLKRSITEGVTSVLRRHGRVIVLEDDLHLSPLALDYFNAALDAYALEPRVIGVCGYMYESRHLDGNDEAFFLPFASSWGWATWDRAWQGFPSNAETLAARAGDVGFLKRFDRQGIIAASRMLRAQAEGLIDSWAILWNAHLTERDALCVFPRQTLVLNEGFASSGATHSAGGNPINAMLRRANAGRVFASSFSLPRTIAVSEPLRRAVARSREATLHRISTHLGYLRRRWKRSLRRDKASVA